MFLLFLITVHLNARIPEKLVFWTVSYKLWLLSIDTKTKVVHHIESEWMREWKSVKVREWVSGRVTEWEWLLRHGNKSYLAGWVNDRLTVFHAFNIITFLVPSFCLTFRHLLGGKYHESYLVPPPLLYRKRFYFKSNYLPQPLWSGTGRKVNQNWNMCECLNGHA